MIEPNSEKEELDIVDEEDMVIRSGVRNEIHRLGLLHREVHVWLFDKNKNIYFQKSPANKSSAGLFDASVGGHVDKGEEYLAAAVRETKEESELLVSPSDLIFLTKFKGVKKHPALGTINNFIRSVYVYKFPVENTELVPDLTETDGGFHKFSINFLSNLDKEDILLFHKFVPTDELPHVLKYLQNTQQYKKEELA
ncbi:NUDIX domain-containing protein [Candidatus Nomurabacteria bacterium]|nr:NUDIX domain-containing protein [Candidatus Nomurabacteria bacterium]